MAASVAREKNHVASGESAGEQFVGRRTEGRFDLHPFLAGEAFDVIQSAAADDADFVFCHGRILTKKLQIPSSNIQRSSKLQHPIQIAGRANWSLVLGAFLGWRSGINRLLFAHGTFSKNP